MTDEQNVESAETIEVESQEEEKPLSMDEIKAEFTRLREIEEKFLQISKEKEAEESPQEEKKLSPEEELSRFIGEFKLGAPSSEPVAPRAPASQGPTSEEVEDLLNLSAEDFAI